MNHIVMSILAFALVLSVCIPTLASGADIQNITGTWTGEGEITNCDGIITPSVLSYTLFNQSSRVFEGHCEDNTGFPKSIIGCIGPDNRSVLMLSEGGVLRIGSFLGSEELISATVHPDKNVSIERLFRNPTLNIPDYKIEDITGWWPFLTTESLGKNGLYMNVTQDGGGIAVINQSGRLLNGTLVLPDRNEYALSGCLSGDGMTIVAHTTKPSLILGRIIDGNTGILHELPDDMSDPAVRTWRFSRDGQYAIPEPDLPDLTGIWNSTESEYTGITPADESEYQPVILSIDTHEGSLFSGDIDYTGEYERIWGAFSDDGRSLLMKGEGGAIILGYLQEDEMKGVIIRHDGQSLIFFSAMR
ncbi:hypothetical protein [Methanospirillum hungatei]|uniref:hypothetical protein n=1 Tax=Methanospirillum hungatei TaxID=2203 RepID=UPI0026F1239A|nr:hypothetical protein [Methanospirillum hungatei]MCA1915244.1 hypothetical protein [Methanospirillum hungatei]